MSVVKDESGGRALNWISTGPEDAPTVVLIHAVGHDLTYWDRQIDALRAAFRVVALDLPGHGRSVGQWAGYGFEDAADAVVHLIESTAKGPVHLAGISFGSMVAQAVVLARLELVRSLCLLGTASAFGEDPRKAMKARAQATRTGGMRAVLQSSLDRWFTPRTIAERPHLIDRMTKTMLNNDPEVHASIWDAIAELNFASRLGEIRCPTLVLVGEQDPSTPPAMASAIAGAIAGASMLIIPDASHMVQLEAPETVNAEMLRFFSAH